MWSSFEIFDQFDSLRPNVVLLEAHVGAHQVIFLQ